jgi:VanZ family protein
MNSLTRYLLLIAWLAVIYYFSAQPNSSDATEKVLGAFNIVVRKLAHVTEYGVLFCLAQNAFRRNRWLTLGFCLLAAAADEYHQSFVPGRSATVGDVLVDTTGMLIACAIIYALERFYSSRALRS